MQLINSDKVRGLIMLVGCSGVQRLLDAQGQLMKLLDWMPSITPPIVSFRKCFIGCPSPYDDSVDALGNRPIRTLFARTRWLVR